MRLLPVEEQGLFCGVFRLGARLLSREEAWTWGNEGIALLVNGDPTAHDTELEQQPAGCGLRD